MDNSNSYSLSNRGSHRESALAHEVDCFGSSEVPSTPRNKRVSPTPSSISPISRKIDMNDPIEVAKSMMEKMQKRRSDHSLHSRHSRHSMAAPGKVHFDTDMLKDLVAQTLRLKHKLVRAVDGYPDKGGLRLKIRAVEDDKFDFDLDLSPIKGTMDDNIGGLEYTPVIGVV